MFQNIQFINDFNHLFFYVFFVTKEQLSIILSVYQIHIRLIFRVIDIILCLVIVFETSSVTKKCFGSLFF